MIMADKLRASGVMQSPFLFPRGEGLPAAAWNNIRGQIFDTIGLWSDASCIKKIGVFWRRQCIPNWRDTIDEDGHYCFAVALRCGTQCFAHARPCCRRTSEVAAALQSLR